MTTIKTYQNYIDGKWVSSVTGETYPSTNPANTEEVLGYFQKSNEVDVQRAMESAFSKKADCSQTLQLAREQHCY